MRFLPSSLTWQGAQLISNITLPFSHCSKLAFLTASDMFSGNTYTILLLLHIVNIAMIINAFIFIPVLLINILLLFFLNYLPFSSKPVWPSVLLRILYPHL